MITLPWLTYDYRCLSTSEAVTCKKVYMSIYRAKIVDLHDQKIER